MSSHESQLSGTEEFSELERYELHEPPAYRFAANRREFNLALGAGLLVFAAASPTQAQRRGRQARREEPLSERLHVGEDGKITVFTSKVEVGQGSRTQITQAAAEELHVPVEQIQLVMADTALCPDDGGTAGSRTTPSTVPRVRNACAAAREIFVDLAAARLAVDRDSIEYERGEFSVAGQRQLTLKELAADTQLPDQLAQPPGSDLAVRRVADWKVLGTAISKVDGKEIVTGRHQFPSDIQLPKMLYGKILRPPAYGARLLAVDLTKAKDLPEVTVVRDGDFVGCAAPTTWQAAKALQLLSESASWQRSEHPSSKALFQHLKSTAQTSGSQGGRRGGREWGDWNSALDSSTQRLQTAYEIAYVQHAPMEPRAAVAQWDEGKLTVWTGTQQPARVEGELRQAFRLGEDSVRVIVPDTGGGFGGKHTGEAAVEAARLAKAAGKPVSLRWTRTEEFTWAYFRPAGLIEVNAALDDSGKLAAWDFTNYNSGGSALDTPYQVPNGRTRVLQTDSPLRQGSYRALASTANTFAREAAMDELAESVGADPLEFRLAHLEPGRLRDVLIAAAERFDWRGKRAANRPVGIACGTEKGSYVAACVEAEVSGSRIHVVSICQAYECGAIQNPQNLQSQVEGCIVMGLGAALREAIEFEDGQITNASFYDYEVPRMKDLPTMEHVFLNRSDLPSVGAGETPIIAVAPALAGAVFVATRKRCRSMPLRLS